MGVAKRRIQARKEHHFEKIRPEITEQLLPSFPLALLLLVD